MVAVLTARPVFADWLVTPFVGGKLDGSTNLVIDLDQAAGETAPAFGVSVARVNRGPFGVEADLAYLPGFFDSSKPGGLVSASRVVTSTGQLMLSAPAAVVRDSLRPYVVVGGGWLHVGMTDVRGVLGASDNYGALAIGGGAIGRTGRRTSVRFDLRRFQTLTHGGVQAVGLGRPRLSFWRASVGLSLHY